MEICWIDNNKVILDYDSKIKKFGLNKEDIKNSKLYKFAKEHPEQVVAYGLVATIGIAAVGDIAFNSATTIAVGAGFGQIDNLFRQAIGFAKKALVLTVIFNTIKDAIMVLWRNSGGKMSWDDIFGSVFKNLAILGVGLAIDKAAWALYEALS